VTGRAGYGGGGAQGYGSGSQAYGAGAAGGFGTGAGAQMGSYGGGAGAAAAVHAAYDTAADAGGYGNYTAADYAAQVRHSSEHCSVLPARPIRCELPG